MEFVLPVRVYIEDTDAGGIVFYVNYLKYMERARTEFMRANGVAKAALGEDGSLLVVRNVQVHYRSPARLDDELKVSAEIISLRPVALMFKQRVYRGDQILCEADIEIACVDGNSGRPKRLPRVMLNHLLESEDGSQGNPPHGK